MMAAPRIALFALEALPNARAVRRFVADHAEAVSPTPSGLRTAGWSGRSGAISPGPVPASCPISASISGCRTCCAR